jgi:hypothetical protein
MQATFLDTYRASGRCVRRSRAILDLRFDDDELGCLRKQLGMDRGQIADGDVPEEVVGVRPRLGARVASIASLERRWQ